MTAHVLGGSVIGADRDHGVVDATHRVFGYRNLLVCDGEHDPQERLTLRAVNDLRFQTKIAVELTTVGGHGGDQSLGKGLIAGTFGVDDRLIASAHASRNADTTDNRCGQHEWQQGNEAASHPCP
jgi:hypothetical protein